MTEYQQPVRGPFTEKLRLIRFRMRKESFQLADEVRIIPRGLVMFVIVLFVVAQLVAFTVNWYGIGNNGDSYWPEYSQTYGAIVVAAAVTGIGLPVACLLFLIGYVNRDARRRGMNSALWTLLVIILLPGTLFAGFIIYFLVREPLPYNCTECGSTVNARFNYCPNCKCNLRPACSQCRREVGDSDHYCPHCGQALSAS